MRATAARIGVAVLVLCAEAPNLDAQRHHYRRDLT